MDGIVGPVELAREAATLVMLAAVGALAGRNMRTRLGYAAIAFGVWDVFYYVFLKMISGWPASLFDWDILFLLPLPWWGPVLAPVCIALLMIVWGTQVTQRAAGRAAVPLTSTAWRLNWLGIALALYVFMADALRAVPQGLDATRMVLPTVFNWPVFARGARAHGRARRVAQRGVVSGRLRLEPSDGWAARTHPSASTRSACPCGSASPNRRTRPTRASA